MLWASINPYPQIDKLACDGQKWNNFYVASSLCTPGRVGLLTGLCPDYADFLSVEYKAKKINQSKFKLNKADKMNKVIFKMPALLAAHLGVTFSFSVAVKKDAAGSAPLYYLHAFAECNC